MPAFDPFFVRALPCLLARVVGADDQCKVLSLVLEDRGHKAWLDQDANDRLTFFEFCSEQSEA